MHLQLKADQMWHVCCSFLNVCFDPTDAGGRAGACVVELIPSGCQHLLGLSLNGPVKMPAQLKHEDHLSAPKSQPRVFTVASSPSAGGGNGTSGAT